MTTGVDDEPELDLSIVIPAFREARKIERDVRDAHEFIVRHGLRAEIIVVDDGSPDDTALRALELATTVPELRVLSYTPNRGKGHAVRYGMLRARGRNVMFADAGLCVPFETALLGISLLDSRKCDIAHASRRIHGSARIAQPWYRRVGSRGFAFLNHTLVGIPRSISDSQCGFKLYRRDVAKALYGQIFSNGGLFDIELILRAVGARLTILEFPVIWTCDPDSNYHPLRGSAMNTLRELADVKWGLATKRKPGLDTVVERSPSAVATGGANAGIKEDPAMSDAVTFSERFLAESAAVIAGLDRDAIERAVHVLARSRDSGGRLFILGVGGSAGNASHAVNDFRVIAQFEAYAPTDNVSELTARTNDSGWASVFSTWLEVSHLKANDTVLVFSVGGGSVEKNVSPNLVLGLQYAERVGSKIVAIVGRDGGFAATVADAAIIIPTVHADHVTPHTEAFQAIVWHLMVSHPALKRFQTKWESVPL